MLPLYRTTLGFTRQRDTSPQDLAWMRAALSNPMITRTLAAGFPAVALDTFGDTLRPRVTMLARAFGAQPAPVPEPATA
jgi:hypothetical protein